MALSLAANSLKSMVVYKTTNLITGKIYVGQCVDNRDSYLGSGKWLKRSIKKYGKQNFKKEILETCNSIEELNEREAYWISVLNSTNPKIGYNILEGGKNHKGSVPWNKGLRGVQKAWNKGLNKNTDERVKEYALSSIKTRKNRKYIAWNKNLKGFNKGHETKKITKEQIQYSQPTRKEIVQYNLKGEFVALWISISEASRSLNINIGNISLCCQGKTKQASGFLWKYLEPPIFNIS